MEYLQYFYVNLLAWSVKSPYFSPTEHIWDILDMRLEMEATWNEVYQDEIDHLIKLMLKQVNESLYHRELIIVKLKIEV